MAADPLPADSVENPEVPPHIANRIRPDEEIGAGILGPDPRPPLSKEQIREMCEGLSAVIDEYEAECGPISEEAHEWARAALRLDDN